MSRTEDLEDDEYIAKLLADDARKTSVKYASMGMSALLPERSTGRVPKPNTRFLKTLVREADSHNAALKRKEEVEARLRLERIGSVERLRESRRDRRCARDSECVHDRAGNGDRKRRRLSDGADDSPRARHTKHERRRASSRSRSPEGEKIRSRESRRHEKTRHDGNDCNDEQRRERRSKKHHSSRRSRSRSKDGNERDSRKDRSRHDRPRQQAEKKQSRNTSPSTSSTTSDPLSSIIGPRPAQHHPSRRGRGFQRDPNSSNIDTHFSSSYNPSLDLDRDLESSQEGADWDNALEALRDRRAWRTKQADRMREAGFGEEEIKRWETTTSRTNAFEGDEDAKPVKWRKKGEEREWDAGKVPRRSVDADGAGDDMDVDDSLVKTDGLQNQRTQNTSVGESQRKSKQKTTATAEQSGRSTRTSVNDNWQRADSGLLRQFRNALR